MTLARQPVAPRPPLLTLVMIVAIFFALGFLVAAASLANGNDFAINGRHVSAEQVHLLSRGLVVSLSLVAVYMAAIAITLLKRHASSRWLMLAYFPIACLANIVLFLLVLPVHRVVDFVGFVIFGVLGTSFVYWYVYRKPNVVAYYQAIEAPAPEPRSMA
jgi:hypothetical protein